MTRFDQRSRKWIALLAGGVAALALCLAPSRALAGPDVYSPTLEDYNAIGGIWGALSTLRIELQGNKFQLCTFVGSAGGATLSAKVTGNGISVTCEKSEPYTFAFGSWVAHARSNRRLMLCKANDDRVIFTRPARTAEQTTCLISAGARGFFKTEDLKRFAIAWQLMSESTSGLNYPTDKDFLDAVAAKPMTDAMRENLRKTQIQVELALKENRREDAAKLYTEALNDAPAWAEGQFNQALLAGELELYQSAVRRMRNYLLLAPNATDARAAQDKIYEWEARLPRPGPP